MTWVPGNVRAPGFFHCTLMWMKTSVTFVSKNSAQCSFVKIRRQYHVHGTDPELHRMIAFVDNAPAYLPTTRCVVQYWFESEREHLVPIKAHGNSRLKITLIAELIQAH